MHASQYSRSIGRSVGSKKYIRELTTNIDVRHRAILLALTRSPDSPECRRLEVQDGALLSSIFLPLPRVPFGRGKRLEDDRAALCVHVHLLILVKCTRHLGSFCHPKHS